MIATVIIGTILLAIVSGIITSMIRRKQKAKANGTVCTACSCGCSGCKSNCTDFCRKATDC